MSMFSVFVGIIVTAGEAPSATEQAGLVSHDSVASFSGLYFARSASNAWVVRISSNGEGALYAPPLTLKIVAVDVNQHTFSFETETLDDRSYRFRAERRRKGLQGTVTVAGRMGKVIASSEVSLTKLPESLPSNWGLYSNIQFIEESGDVFGTALLLAPDSAAVIGFYTIYESDQRDPLPLENPKLSRNKLTFSVREGKEVIHFQAILSERAVTLTQTDAWVEKGHSKIVLPKLKALSQL